MWCHIAYLFPASSHKERLTKYINHKKDVVYTGITFPIILNQIEKIANLNTINFNILALDVAEKFVVPLYISNNNYDKICEMLLIRKVVDNTIKSHFVLITDFSKLLYNQNKCKRKVCYCKRCLQHFSCIEKLDNHMNDCKKIKPQKAIFPNKKDKFVKLKIIGIKFKLLL